MNHLPGPLPRHIARRSRVWRAACALAGAAIFLASCTSGTSEDVPENRQFANEPAPTHVATESPTAQPTTVTGEVPRREPDPSPEDLLRPRGAPSTLYTIAGGQLIALHPEPSGVAQEALPLPPGAEAAGVASSPTGDRVAVLLEPSGGGPAMVVFIGEDGARIGEWPLGVDATASPGASPVASPVGTQAATPAEAGGQSTGAITWQPQANGVLVLENGVLYAVDADAGPETVGTAGVAGTIVAAAASPTGEQILLHAVEDDGSHRVYLIQRSSGEANELFALRTGPGMVLDEVTWLPTGKGVVFVEGELSDGAPMRGQLFLYRFRDAAPRLLATSGQGGPSASIRHVAVSPDGSAVAYEIAVRDIDQWSTHSVWVRPMREGGAAVQLPIESGHTITGLTWSREGLAWQYTSRYGAEGDFVGVIGRHGEVETVVEVGATSGATPIASPMASPVTSPVASPVASPGATPIASPVATPVR